jgi:mono/diheme cytochrome c family protein
MSLSDDMTDALLNDDGANWCAAVDVYGDGDLGTPGVANPECESAVVAAAADDDGDGFALIGADLQPIFDTSCVGCHGASTASGDLVLEGPDVVETLLGESSAAGMPYIDSGFLENSYLWHKVNGTHLSVDGGSGSLMPMGATLSSADLDLIRDAIELADCDDSDVSTYPGAVEIADDGIDQDCDGVDEVTVAAYLTVAELLPGDLVITEVMQNPSAVSDSAGEWFEVYNASGMDIDLNDLEIGDEDNWSTTTVVGSTMVLAGQYIVFAEESDIVTNGGVSADYDYSSSFALGNSSDELILSVGGLIIDEIWYDNGATFPDPSGASMSLSGDAMDVLLNDDGANWCEGVDAYGDGDLGTPGAENSVCVD